ncbi:hypothetical protein PQR21_23780 [Paraburkholderia nemoris]|uniref:hypothetical protein n=1 Tax=Paraburkholderia nemoris TaxID=2793076 RepID=UPI0038B9879B
MTTHYIRRFSICRRSGLLIAVASGMLSAGPLLADTPQCALQAPKPLNIDIVQPEFRRHFCLGMKTERCDKRWTNISPLMTKLASDPNVETVGTAAYILATTFVETGVADFDPATVERLPSNGSKPPYYPWIGRGWVQLTYRDKYQAVFKTLGIDVINHPELAQEPANSYRILVEGMTKGSLENYRSSPGGGCPAHQNCQPPIKLADFVNASKADYGHARAVINANCLKPAGHSSCEDILYEGKGYIPDVSRIDAAVTAATQAKQFENMLCQGMGLRP